MSSIKDFVVALDNSIQLNEQVVNALKDIVLSTKVSTTIENDPVQTTEYFHQKGASYLYDREPLASDMFDGAAGSAANNVPSPVIGDFSLGSTPDVLNDHLEKIIQTSVSINDVTKITLGTLREILAKYANESDRNKLKELTKVWKTFKIGEYWPSTYGLSFNSDANSTAQSNTSLICNATSKYAFIKLSPDRDYKYHYLTIDIDMLGDNGIPVIFVILDSYEARDGDSFEFRIKYTSQATTSSQKNWPEILFFDSSYNSNGIPLPSNTLAYDTNEKEFNNSVKIDGIDYYYVLGSELSSSILAKYSIQNTDRVFISSAELNNKIYNHPGEISTINFGSLCQSKAIGYGIQNSNTLKILKNDELLITSEVPNNSDNEANQQLFSKTNTIKYTNNQISFTGLPGTSIFYGRNSSFFAPISAASYVNVSDYSNAIEGISGNVLKQYNSKSFSSYLKNTDNNGIIIEFEINQSALNGNTTAIRVGHFESILGLTIQYNTAGISASYQNASSGITSVNIISTQNLKCQCAFISANNIMYARYSIKDNTSLLHDSGLIAIGTGDYSELLIANSSLSSVSNKRNAILNYLPESDIFTYWSPVISCVIDGRSSTATTTATIKNLVIKHELYKEEFDSYSSEFTSFANFMESPQKYWANYDYKSVRGVMEPIVLRPEDIPGFLCRVDAFCSSTYSKTNTAQSTMYPIYRVGFVYNGYKGSITYPEYIEYEPAHGTNKQTITETKDFTNSVSIDTSKYPAQSRKLIDPIYTSEPTTVIASNEGDAKAIPPTFEKMQADSEIDNLDGHFGWKICTFHQSIA